MRKLLILLSLSFTVMAFSSDVKAQTKKRIGLSEGADSMTVNGKISGKKYALYEIYVAKGEAWDVKLTSSNEYIGYTVKDAKGNKYDFLEAAPVEGYYVIRVELNSAGSKSRKTAVFRLDITFEMGKSKPIGE